MGSVMGRYPAMLQLKRQQLPRYSCPLGPLGASSDGDIRSPCPALFTLVSTDWLLELRIDTLFFVSKSGCCTFD